MRIRAFQDSPATRLGARSGVRALRCRQNTPEAARARRGQPHSLPSRSREIDLPADTDPHADAVYAKAHEKIF